MQIQEELNDLSHQQLKLNHNNNHNKINTNTNTNTSSSKSTQTFPSSKLITFLTEHAPSYLLINKGATARDHLANERTFLAYLRTSLSLMTVGIAIMQLFKLSALTRPPTPTQNNNTQSQSQIKTAEAFGGIFIILSAFVLIGGTVRYFYAQNLMMKGVFPSSRGLITFMSVGMLMIVFSLFLISFFIGFM